MVEKSVEKCIGFLKECKRDMGLKSRLVKYGGVLKSWRDLKLILGLVVDCAGVQSMEAWRDMELMLGLNFD